jgi:hypothetical protein
MLIGHVNIYVLERWETSRSERRSLKHSEQLHTAPKKNQHINKMYTRTQTRANNKIMMARYFTNIL